CAALRTSRSSFSRATEPFKRASRAASAARSSATSFERSRSSTTASFGVDPLGAYRLELFLVPSDGFGQTGSERRLSVEAKVLLGLAGIKLAARLPVRLALVPKNPVLIRAE